MQPERAATQPFSCIKESVRSPEPWIDWREGAPRRCAPQLALELEDAVGKLRRPAGSGDIGVRAPAHREAHVPFGQAREEREYEARMGQRGEVPWFGACEAGAHGSAEALQGVGFGAFLGSGRFAFGLGLRRRHALRPDPGEEVAQLGQLGVLRAQRPVEPRFDAFEVRQRRVGEVIGTTDRQRPFVDDRVEQLARPPHELQQVVDLREPARFKLCHGPILVPSDPCQHRDGAGRPSTTRWYRSATGARATLRTMDMPRAGQALLTAELISVGSEITVGDTRDTNAGELARDLTARGVRVLRLGAVPDELAVVRDALEEAVSRADLVVTTGGLGPTPDDLTREAIAALVGEDPTIDPEMEAWLRDRFERRGMAFPEVNLKQAWRIPSAEPLPNPNGTAPGWLVRLPGDQVIVTLPGPPREMRAMWHDEAIPRLSRRGLGQELVARTYRLHGIGESHVAELLGDALLRGKDPDVATYARVEAVDVRVASSGPGAQQRVDEAAAMVEEQLGTYVWATGDTTWADAVAEALTERGWTLAFAELGLGGSLTTLLGGLDGVLRTESAATEGDGEVADLSELADMVRLNAGSDVGLAVRALPHGEDTAVTVTVRTPEGDRTERRVAFLGGPIGRSRAAMAAASVLLHALRESPAR